MDYGDFEKELQRKFAVDSILCLNMDKIKQINKFVSVTSLSDS